MAIAISTLWGIQNMQKTFDNDLKDKALTAESIFSATIVDSLDNETLLQAKVKEAAAAKGNIKEITILKPLSDGFEAIASSNDQSVNLSFKSNDYTNAWVGDQNVATLAKETNNGQVERYWIISSPIKDHALQKQALCVFKLSLHDSDLETKKNITATLITLAITIFFVLLLLINHFRFYEYAVSYKSLAEIDRLKDDFISIASHEMKTPMAAIKGYLSMIDEGIAGSVDKKAKTHLEKVTANVHRLDILVNELLDVSRLEQQRVQFDMQPVDMTEAVKSTIAELKGEADKKGLYLRSRDLPAPRPQVFADPERIAQILDNLVGNAIKYTERGGIEIFYQVIGNRLYTAIKDTGIGMASPDQKRLFEKFYRIQNKKTMDIPGTGLGLWITREMVRRMNGDITVSSTEGVGSQFAVGFSIIKDK